MCEEKKETREKPVIGFVEPKRTICVLVCCCEAVMMILEASSTKHAQHRMRETSLC